MENKRMETADKKKKSHTKYFCQHCKFKNKNSIFLWSWIFPPQSCCKQPYASLMMSLVLISTEGAISFFKNITCIAKKIRKIRLFLKMEKDECYTISPWQFCLLTSTLIFVISLYPCLIPSIHPLYIRMHWTHSHGGSGGKEAWILSVSNVFFQCKRKIYKPKQVT